MSEHALKDQQNYINVNVVAALNEKVEKQNNEFLSISRPLELIIGKTNQGSEREEKLMDPAIVLNEESEIIINVDLPTSFDIISPPENVFPPPEDVLPAPEDILTIIKSPIKRKTPHDINELRTSKRLKAKKESTKMDDQFNTSRVENFVGQCPLTFDGAFGLTKEKHSLEICPSHKSYGRNLLSHLMEKHQMKKVYADVLHKAAANELDPALTNLFTQNEEVIDHGRFIPCPLAGDMNDLFGDYIKPSPKIPCPNKSIHEKNIQRHLREFHGFKNTVALRITESYKNELLKMKINP
ncbi:unnamed protein product [Adineta steineri]|nr:unnamed protein product [Adineta steineri]